MFRCALVAAVAAACIGFVIVFGFDPRTVLRIGWRTSLLPLLMYKHHDYGPEGGFKAMRSMSSGAWIDKIANFQPLDDDVLISTFPKSGTHFATQIVLQTLSGGRRDFDSVHHVITIMELEDVNPVKCEDPRILNIDNYKDMDPDHRGVHTSHLPSGVVKRGGKRLVMMRNPVDVLSSLHVMIGKMMGPGRPTMEEIYSQMFRDVFTGYYQYHLDYWIYASNNPDEVLWLFYEDAVANPRKTVVEVATFLNAEVNSEEIEQILYKSSLKYMKPNKLKFEPPSNCIDLMPLVRVGKADMINKGKAGRGKENVPEAIRMEIKKEFEETFAGTDFPVQRYIDAIL